MNLQLANTEEFIEGQFTGNLGEVLIRYACSDGCVAAYMSEQPACEGMYISIYISSHSGAGVTMFCI